jgi:hypothetical protein
MPDTVAPDDVRATIFPENGVLLSMVSAERASVTYRPKPGKRLESSVARSLERQSLQRPGKSHSCRGLPIAKTDTGPPKAAGSWPIAMAKNASALLATWLTDPSQ